jgi:hypothetical protein
LKQVEHDHRRFAEPESAGRVGSGPPATNPHEPMVGYCICESATTKAAAVT